MKKFMNCSCGAMWQDKGYLILRIVTGLAFFYHGYDKVFVKGVDNIAIFFGNVGIPLAQLSAFLVSYGELIGGLFLMFGFLTHWVSKVNILIMLGAIGFVHLGKEGGWFYGYGAEGGYEYQLLLLAASIFFLVSGSGKYSIDYKMADKQTSAPATETTVEDSSTT